MDDTQIRKLRDAVVEQSGPWFGCIHLGGNVYTLDELHIDTRVRQCLQTVSDVVCKPLAKIRVLDLACLEGHFAIEFALHGAEVIGIEGREVNLRKAEFISNLLSLDNLKLIHDDVRNLNRDRYGDFDVVLCHGILYHMDAPDAMHLIKNVFECCTRVAVINTHFSLSSTESYCWNGNSYWGHYITEHAPTTTQDQQLDNLWASIGNLRSFVLTRPSLYNLLRHVGFTSIYECLNPYVYTHHASTALPVLPGDDRHAVWEDRSTFVAIKGERQRVISSPVAEALAEIDRPEKPPYLKPPASLTHNIVAYLPERARKGLSALYHSVTGR